MPRLVRNLSLIAALSVLVAAGCDGGAVERTVEPSSAEQTNSTATEESARLKSTASGPPIAAANVQTPDAAVRAVLDGLNDHNPKAVWDFLPASYHQDINDLVHLFAKNVDANLWELLFQVADDAVHLLRTKKAFLLSYPALKENPRVDLAELEKNWDSSVAIFATLSESELSDLGKLQSIDVGAFLETTGRQLMTQLAALSNSLPDDPLSRQFGRQLKETKVALIESKGDTAVVRLTPADPKVPATDVPFVQVEGKWVPRSLAEGWKPAIEQLKQTISMLGRGKPVNQDQSADLILSQLAAAIAELQVIETADEFHQRLDDELPKLATLFDRPASSISKSSGATPAAATEPASRDAGVTIAIDAPLDEQAEDTLCNQLNAIADHPDVAVTETPMFARGRTTIRVWPVADVAAYAKRIDFARVIKLDNNSRTIVIELGAKRDEAKN
ncbi:MAG: hypothetical protein WD648_12215 [Planctomycetaceae bacterium]